MFSNHAKLPPLRRATCEPLETRRLFITYQVEGTSGNDTISINISGNSILSVVNGQSDTASDIINNNIEISGLGSADTISIIKTGNNTVTVNAGSGDDTVVLGASNHDMDFIEDSVTVNGEGGSDLVTFRDDAHSGPQNYDLNTNAFTRSGVTTSLSGVEDVDIRSSINGFNALDIAHLPVPDSHVTGNVSTLGTELLFRDSGGDSLSYAPGGAVDGSGTIVFESRTLTFDTIREVTTDSLPTISITTPNPEDQLNLDASANDDATLTGTSGGIDVADLRMIGFTTLNLLLATNDAGGGDDVVQLFGDVPSDRNVRLDAGTGSNRLTVADDYSAIDTNLGANAGNNVLAVIGANARFVSPQSLNELRLNGGVATFVGSGNVLTTAHIGTGLGTGGALNLNAGQSANVNDSSSLAPNGTFTKSGLGTLNINAGFIASNFSTLAITGGVCNLNGNAGDSLDRRTTLSVSTGATLNIAREQDLAGLVCDGTVNVLPNGNRLIFTKALSVGAQGRLNLNDNDLAFDYSSATSPIPLVNKLIRTARNNGAWDGPGITSTTAKAAPHNTTLGTMEATDYHALFGQSALFTGRFVDATSVLVKYTYYGDANFDGRITFDDYVKIDSGFNTGRTGWVNGDFNLDGAITFDDFVLIDIAFNTQGAQLGRMLTNRPESADVNPVHAFSVHP